MKNPKNLRQHTRHAVQHARHRLLNRAWQVAVSYVLTGEDASYSGVVPNRPFGPVKNAWGAVELATRDTRLEVDHAAVPRSADPSEQAGAAGAWAIGANWYLNPNVKAVLNHDQTGFDGGIADAGDLRNERVLAARLQMSF